MLCIGRFSIKLHSDYSFGYFDNKIMDVKGFSFGWVTFGWWYDDIPEGWKDV
jgi:hypothetical protein